MIGVVHPRLHDLQLMQCLLLGSHRHIFAPIHIVQFVKKNLNLVLKPERCHVIIFTIPTVLFLGWLSITRVLFAVLSCHHTDKSVLVQAVEATTVEIVAQGAGRVTVQTMEGEIHFRFCGHSVLQVQTIINILRLEEAALQPMLTRITEQVIMDGITITKKDAFLLLDITAYLIMLVI
jgi:hypothetical protein